MMDKEFEEALAREWGEYCKRGAATVDALEDNTQELAFAKGFYRGYKEAAERASEWLKLHMPFGEVDEQLRDDVIEMFKREIGEGDKKL